MPSQATGARASRSHNLGLLAEAYAKAGQIEAAFTTLAEALAVEKKLGSVDGMRNRIGSGGTAFECFA
jgi:hypothetical protein